MDAELQPDFGIPTVVLSEASLNAADQLELTREVDIPGDAAQTLLTRVDGLTIDSAGNVTIVDPEGHYVSTFDRVGGLVRRFGGQGDGPGELRRPFLIAAKADTFYVIDERGVNIFSVHGKYVRRIPLAMTSNHVGRSYAQHFPHSVAMANDVLVISEVTPTMTQPDTPYQDILNLRSVNPRTGRLSETFQAIASEVYYPASGAQWGARFGAKSHFAVLPDGRIVANGLEGRTLNVFEDGRLVERIVFDAPRRKVTSEELRKLSARREERFKELLNTSQVDYGADFVGRMARATRRLPHFRFHPTVGRVLSSPEGQVWVHRPDLSVGTLGWDGLWGSTVWDVFDRKLQLSGRVELPPGFTPLVVTGNLVAGTTTDSLDIPSISAYRIAPGRN